MKYGNVVKFNLDVSGTILSVKDMYEPNTVKDIKEKIANREVGKQVDRWASYTFKNYNHGKGADTSFNGIPLEIKSRWDQAKLNSTVSIGNITENAIKTNRYSNLVDIKNKLQYMVMVHYKLVLVNNAIDHDHIEITGHDFYNLTSNEIQAELEHLLNCAIDAYNNKNIKPVTNECLTPVSDDNTTHWYKFGDTSKLYIETEINSGRLAVKMSYSYLLSLGRQVQNIRVLNKNPCFEY